MRIAFAGTPPFAARALEALIDAGHELGLVLTQPDRPAGRGMKTAASAVKAVAMRHGLPLAQPRSLRLDGRYPDDAAAAQAALLAAAPQVLVVAAYGLILPAWTLTLPPAGCLNIHGSILPRWRGAAPVQRAIEAGDALTGITIMQMDSGLDTGAMRLVRECPIRPDDTAASLTDRLAGMGAEAIVAALAALEAGQLPMQAQPAEGVTYAHKIEKAEAPLDWSADAAVLERRIRAFDPFPGASFGSGAEAVKVWRAAAIAGQGLPPGMARWAAPHLEVSCGLGALRLLELQRPGGRRLAAEALTPWLRTLDGQPLAMPPQAPQGSEGGGR